MVVLSQASQNCRERTDPTGPSPYSYDSIASGSVFSTPTEDLSERLRYTGWPCGEEEFAQEAEQMTGRRLRPGGRGRPGKDKK